MDERIFTLFAEESVAVWVALIAVTLVDWLLRRRFNLAYLAMALPLKKRFLNATDTLKPSLQANRIVRLGEFKIYMDEQNSVIWAQPARRKFTLLFGFVHRLSFSRATRKVGEVTLCISLGSVAANALLVALFYVLNAGKFGAEFSEFGENFIFYFLTGGVLLNLAFMTLRAMRAGRRILALILTGARTI